MHKLFEMFFVLTLVIFWWVAEWGIIAIAIDNYAGDSQIRDLSIYIGILSIILILLYFQPNLTQHLHH